MRSWLSGYLLLLLPATAIAGAPWPPSIPGGCSRIPARIVLVGTNGAHPDALVGSFEVSVCRGTLPMYGAIVHLSSPDGSAARLGRDTDPEPAYQDCPDPSVRFITDANGLCRVTLSGTVALSELLAGATSTVRIFANGVLFGDVPVVCYDLDGSGGVGARDLSSWLQLFGSGTNPSVADYNGDGSVGAGDLSQWLAAFGSGAQAVSATPLCP